MPQSKTIAGPSRHPSRQGACARLAAVLHTQLLAPADEPGSKEGPNLPRDAAHLRQAYGTIKADRLDPNEIPGHGDRVKTTPSSRNQLASLRSARDISAPSPTSSEAGQRHRRSSVGSGCHDPVGGAAIGVAIALLIPRVQGAPGAATSSNRPVNTTTTAEPAPPPLPSPSLSPPPPPTPSPSPTLAPTTPAPTTQPAVPALPPPVVETPAAPLCAVGEVVGAITLIDLTIYDSSPGVVSVIVMGGARNLTDSGVNFLWAPVFSGYGADGADGTKLIDVVGEWSPYEDPTFVPAGTGINASALLSVPADQLATVTEWGMSFEGQMAARFEPYANAGCQPNATIRNGERKATPALP